MSEEDVPGPAACSHTASLDLPEDENIPGQTASSALVADSDNETISIFSIDGLAENHVGAVAACSDAGISASECAVTNGFIDYEEASASNAQESELQPSSISSVSEKKHVFVLSEAGKPIYSRYGNEEDLTTLMGILQALVSFVQASSDNDELQSICVGDHRFVFLHRSPLILVIVSSRRREAVSQLHQQLVCLYQQIVSILTVSQLTKIFEQRNNFDLRRLLTGTQRTFENLLKLVDDNPGFLLNAVKCLPLAPALREAVGSAISAQASKNQNLVFAILVASEQIVTVGRMKTASLHPSDILLVINMVSSNPSFRLAESWSPICLPKFHNSGYLHAHISYLSDSCPACLLLLTVERNSFFEMAEIKRKICERLKRAKVIEGISEACAAKGFSVADVNVPELVHFLYKNRSSSQFTCPEFGVPYNDPREKERVISLYFYVHDRMHSPVAPTKIFYHVGDKEAVLGWITTTFELMAVFTPLVTKSAAVLAVDKLMKWLKKEEDKLFLKDPPLF